MVREREPSLANSPGRVSFTCGAALSNDVQGSAPAGSTHTGTAFERIESARVALRREMPFFANFTVVWPSAPVTAPPTLAPASGEPLAPSVTFTLNPVPVCADAGPA